MKKDMKKTMLFCAALLCLTMGAKAQTIGSPDGKIQVILELSGGKPCYSVNYQGQTMLNRSALGVVTNIGDYTQGLTLKEGFATMPVSETYTLNNIKQREVSYQANEGVATYLQNNQPVMDVIFRVSNRDVAFRYKIYPKRDTRVCVVQSEASGFVLPEGTTTFLCPQSKPMGGFARTSPSYETSYSLDDAMGKNGWGEGYTFPCLFKVPGKSGISGEANWLLISETGTDGGYVGCRLLNEGGANYRIGFPQPGELNGVGSVTPAMSLPGETPWRTITVGPLANIVETTVPFDLVQPKYKASQEYIYGKGSWSWIIGMDGSCNFDEQKRYIDFSAAMGYQSVLIDAFWDKQIGYEKVAELARYGKTKGVGLFLWYNSNGKWNDAPQTPIGKMDNARIRREEMKWMHDNGIRGIKVDFFGGDISSTDVRCHAVGNGCIPTMPLRRLCSPRRTCILDRVPVMRRPVMAVPIRSSATPSVRWTLAVPPSTSIIVPTTSVVRSARPPMSMPWLLPCSSRAPCSTSPWLPTT